MRSPELQAKVIRCILEGKGSSINVVAGDFREHIDSLLCIPHSLPSNCSIFLDEFERFMVQGGVGGAGYLFERGWFCRDQMRQERTALVILKGLGSRLCTVAGDYNDHLDELLG